MMYSSARKLVFLAFAIVGTSHLAYAQDEPTDNAPSAEDIAKLNDIFGSSSTSEASNSSDTFDVQTVLSNSNQTGTASDAKEPAQTGITDSSEAQVSQTTPAQEDNSTNLFKAESALDNLEKAVETGTLGQNVPNKNAETPAATQDPATNTDASASNDLTVPEDTNSDNAPVVSNADNTTMVTDAGSNNAPVVSGADNTTMVTDAGSNNAPVVSGADNAAMVTDAGSDNAQTTSVPSSMATTASNSAETVMATTVNEDEPTIMTDALLDKQLREVSTSVDTLKEDTFTTKSRLLLLREEVLQRSVGGSRLQLKHKYDMGGQYEIVQVYYAIDQETIFSKQDFSGKLSELNDQVIYDKLLAPGPHQLTVMYVYKGRPWGVFQYMKNYTFRVESGYDFIVDEGKAAELIVTAAENGNFFTAYEKRPGVKFDYQQYDLAPQSAIEAQAASESSHE